MAEESVAAEAGGQSTIVERVAGGDGALSLRDAANSLLDTRRKETAGERRKDEEGEAQGATAEQESPPQGEDTAQETGPGETQEADAQVETPDPIEPPRSWTKEDKELFKGLPRETQERLVDRERSRESDFLRRQNEAAEKTKALSAKEQQAEQVRQQYENALPQLLQALQATQAGEFADIKSVADIDRMSIEDWPRYIRWDAQQKKIAAVQQEVQAANQRKATKEAQEWSTFAQEQDSLLLDKAPDLATPEAQEKAAKAAASMLKEHGFTDKELFAAWNGQEKFSLRDHRWQLVVRDAARYREAKTATPKAAVKVVPKVQRPGPARPANADGEERFKALDSRLTQSGSLRDAAAALAARRAASR